MSRCMLLSQSFQLSVEEVVAQAGCRVVERAPCVLV